MDETLKAVITYFVTFVGGYLSRYVEPRAKLVHWFPGWVTFAVPLPQAQAVAAPQAQQPAPAPAPGNVNVSTHTLTIQNTGWRPATQIEIVHGQAPQLFRFTPPINFAQGTKAGHDAADVRRPTVPEESAPSPGSPRRRDRDLLALADCQESDPARVGLYLGVGAAVYIACTSVV